MRPYTDMPCLGPVGCLSREALIKVLEIAFVSITFISQILKSLFSIHFKYYWTIKSNMILMQAIMVNILFFIILYYNYNNIRSV